MKQYKVEYRLEPTGIVLTKTVEAGSRGEAASVALRGWESNPERHIPGQIRVVVRDLDKDPEAPEGLGLVAQGSSVLFLTGPNPGEAAARGLAELRNSTTAEAAAQYGLALIGTQDRIPIGACAKAIRWHYQLETLGGRQYPLGPFGPFLTEMLDHLAGRPKWLKGGTGFCLTSGCQGSLVNTGEQTNNVFRFACYVCACEMWGL